MKLGIITYDKPHRKTQDIIKGLNLKGYNEITIIINKYKEYKNKKKNTIYNHRPFQFEGLTPEELAKKYNYKIKKIEEKKFNNDLDYILICGSNLLDKKYIKKNFIINCHSGLIPETRGLDSIKWAVYNNKQVGNTLHFIDEKTDKGEIISQKTTPVYSYDNFQTFSERHYKNEIEMIINFEFHIKNPVKLNLKQSAPTMRMPFQKEENLLNKFENYQKKYLLDKDFNKLDEKNAGIVSVSFGKNVKVIKPVNLYNCTIGDNSLIGPFVEIQSNVVVGKNTRIQSHSFLCELVTIGDNCFIGHGVFFTNDLFKDGKRSYGDISKWKETTVSDNVSIGSNCTILPVKICEGAVIGGGSVVTKDINIKGTYAGNPAKLLKKL